MGMIGKRYFTDGATVPDCCCSTCDCLLMAIGNFPPARARKKDRYIQRLVRSRDFSEEIVVAINWILQPRPLEWNLGSCPKNYRVYKRSAATPIRPNRVSIHLPQLRSFCGTGKLCDQSNQLKSGFLTNNVNEFRKGSYSIVMVQISPTTARSREKSYRSGCF
jgi:hypothetical protein